MNDAPDENKGFDGRMLEQRVARLEEDMREVKSTLKGIEAKLVTIEVAVARIEGRLQGVPSSWQLFTALVTTVVATWSAGAAIVFTLLRFAKP